MAILESREDQRKFPRLAAGIRIRFRGAALRKADREYLEGVAENVSLGGMFIATSRPPREGSLISLEFDRPAVAGGRPVRAKALVCWRRRWRQPRGMGIRFVELEGLGPLPIAVWLEEVLAGEAAGTEGTTEVFPVFG